MQSPNTEAKPAGLGFRVQGPGFRVQGSGSRVQGSGFRVQGPGFRRRSTCNPMYCARFEPSSIVNVSTDTATLFRVEGLGFRVEG